MRGLCENETPTQEPSTSSLPYNIEIYVVYRHSHVDENDVRCYLLSNGLDHLAEVGHEAIVDHEGCDDVRVAGLQESHTRIIASDTQHLSRKAREVPASRTVPVIRREHHRASCW